MAKIRDRTEDFKDAVRRETVSLEYNESKVAAVMASFIIHKPRERTPFMKSSLKTLESIGELGQYLMKHKRDYVDMHRTTEHERDSIEQEVTSFVKLCQKQIEVLKASISDEEANSKSWLGTRTDGSNADTIAHKHGVVLILSEKLHSVTSEFDRLRAVRFQDALNRTMPRRKRSRISDQNAIDNLKSKLPEVKEHDEVEPSPQRVQEQLLDDDTRALQVELSNLLDAAQETETKMVEMSALNHLLATHVLQQVQQIEYLYDQAVEATKNVVLGNKELTQAIQRNSSSRIFNVLFVVVLIFAVLFLDWYN
ncbi:syntaxin-81-like [Spinacia oleracea]|uniref:Syntaxin-81-like n=1 Tax=Spinacia oleracea TaxID=3562 RepID=A0A9R0JEF5_SPIOL|nr:syntaxin-81-like [Spinacia oleracea]